MPTLVLGSKTIEFADLFDTALKTRHDIEKMMKKNINLLIFNDSLYILDITTKASAPVEQRLVINLEAVKNASQTQEIEQIGFIRSQYDLEYCLKKNNGHKSPMFTLKAATINHPVYQWIERTHNENISRQK